ncbi:hypothetical protein KR009_011607, partial [Drosophila setifemur]
MHGHLIIAGLLTVIYWSLVESMMFRSTGNCSYAKDEVLQFVCKGKVSQDIQMQYRDMRAPAGTPFTVWKSNDNSVVMVSFHEWKLAQYRKVSILVQFGVPIFNVEGSGVTKKYVFTPTSIHCFPYALRYPIELRNECLGRSSDRQGKDVAKNPILHYASFSV